jgi:hypothetical protein
MYKVKQFFKRIYNLYRWFPIIWNDQDWDDHYIFEILKFKLKNQAEYIGYHDRHMSAKRDAEIMMLCVSLLDKVQTEYYNTEYLDYEESKFNFIPIEGTDTSEIKINHISDNLNDYFNKYPLVYKEVVCQHIHNNPDKHRIAMYMSRVNHDRARKLLFKLMERNIERWWD